jgi:pre-mRNA-splicing factor ISY1
MTDLEGNEVDVLSATGKGPNYRYFGATKLLPILKEIFNNPPRGEEEEV